MVLAFSLFCTTFPWVVCWTWVSIHQYDLSTLLSFSLSHCTLVLASGSCCFQTCNKNSVPRLLVTLAYTHCRELMKWVGKLWWISCYHTCYCWWSLNKWATVTKVCIASFIGFRVYSSMHFLFPLLQSVSFFDFKRKVLKLVLAFVSMRFHNSYESYI